MLDIKSILPLAGTVAIYIHQLTIKSREMECYPNRLQTSLRSVKATFKQGQAICTSYKMVTDKNLNSKCSVAAAVPFAVNPHFFL